MATLWLPILILLGLEVQVDVYKRQVLTTVVQPSEQISLQSIELLVRQIEHGAPAQTITLQPELQHCLLYTSRCV